VKIGERARPSPGGCPGYIRIDTVHQGDLSEEKGVYHINAVDEVTQWEIVASVEKIAEGYLVPVLESMLAGFPFFPKASHDGQSELPEASLPHPPIPLRERRAARTGEIVFLLLHAHFSIRKDSLVALAQ